MLAIRILAAIAVLVAGCLRKDNPYYCPGAPDNNCTEIDAGMTCSDDTQCSAPMAICDMQQKACVECTAAKTAACTGAHPVCGTDEHCRPCASHAECPMSNTCLPDGSCAEPAEVAYVSVPGGADNPMCTLAMPCAKIMKALETNRPYLKLHGTIDEAVMINDRSVTVLADPDTTLTRGGAGNIVTVNGASNVKIYDLAINGASGNGSGILLPSGSTQTVTLGRVSMTANNGALGAVVASGGTIHIQRSRIFNNASGGISITAAQFDIENNFITGNGTDGVAGATSYGGISLFQTNAGTRTLSFNTISDNKGGLDAATGVSCAQVTQDLTASNNIIYGNRVQGIGAQVDGNHCLWTYSDIGPGAVPAGAGNRSDDPKFMPGDFHLQSVSQLIDQADLTATLGVDIDGDARPQNGRRDIGADEYVPPH